jgi:hypothetical protein
MLWGKAQPSGEVPLAITSICAGKSAGELVYSLESGSLCALLEVAGHGTEERRLWNDNRTRLRHVSISPESGDFVFSVLHENGTANIGVKLHGESGYAEVTEGDSFDTAPRWAPGGGKRMVFQSAGIGRNREGQFLALGPFSVQSLDAETGEMSALLEDSRYDYLAPSFQADGSLLYIRRPHQAHERWQPLRSFKDMLLLPFRLLYAVFQYLNFFSTIYTGKKLTSAGGQKGRDMDLKQMMIWGNLVRSQPPANIEDESADLVPKSWQLFRRHADGKSAELASGVLAYDAAPDGTIAYTNGNAIYVLQADGRKERVVQEAMIEQVFLLPG